MKELIQKFWNRDLSRSGRQHLLDMLEQENVKDVNILDDIEEPLSANQRDRDRIKERSWSIIAEIISPELKFKPQRLSSKIIWKIAACFILLIGFGLFRYYDHSLRKTVIVTKSTKTIKNTENWVHLYGVNVSVIKKLPDGTTATIYPQSELVYDKKTYNLNERGLILVKGRASFDVVKNKHKAFIVHSGNILTKALGTFFEVDYTQLEKIRIWLEHGKLEIKGFWPNGKPIPSKILFSRQGYCVNIHNNTVNDISGNTNPDKGTNALQYEKKKKVVNNSRDSFYFYQQALPTVFENLESYYDVNIEYKDVKAIDQFWFTGNFSKKHSLYNILSIIAASNGLSVTIENNKYIVSN